MKKISKALLLMLVVASVVSFTTGDESEITITVTSDKNGAFDMFQITDQPNTTGGGRTVKGLATPYKMNIKSKNGKFIFRSSKLKSSLKIKVETTGKAVLQADWQITVLLIDQGNISAFGMD